MKVYVLRHSNKLFDCTFYLTKELARRALKKKRDEIIAKPFPAVNVINDTEDEFSFYFGWEEHRVAWRVKEIEVLESE